MVMGTLLFPDIRRASPQVAWWLTRPLWWVAAGLAILTLIDYIHIGVKYLGENSSQAEKAGQD